MEREMENVPPWKTSSRLVVPVAEHLSASSCAPVSDQNLCVNVMPQKPLLTDERGGNTLVCVTLILHGSWVVEGGTWVYVGAKALKNIMIKQDIDFNSLKNVIKLKGGHGASYAEWALSYVLKSKEGGQPIIIADDDDLEAFKFLNLKCGEDPWPLAIYVGPLETERFEVKQPAEEERPAGEERLSGPPSSQKVDNLAEIVNDEVDGKAHQSPLCVDGVLHARGEVTVVIGKSKELTAMDIPDKGIISCDKGMWSGDRVQGLAAMDILDKGTKSCDKGMFSGDRVQGLEVIELGDTDTSSGDMGPGLDVICLGSEEEDDDGLPPTNEFWSSFEAEGYEVKLEEDWDDLDSNGVEEDTSMRVLVEEEEVEEEVMRELEHFKPRISVSPHTIQNIDVMMDRATTRTQDPRRNITQLSEGQLFASKADVQTCLRWNAVENCFEFIAKRSTTKVLVVVCVDPNCTWMCRASPHRRTTMWSIRKYVQEHTCGINVNHNHNRHATSDMIGRNLVSK